MKIHELLSDPAKWTQDANARDKHGNPVNAESEDAVCWCLIGALYKCYPVDHRKAWERLVTVIDVLYAWNDSHTHAEVLDLVRRLDV